MGPSEDTADPLDALSGSQEQLLLVNGDTYLVKNICPTNSSLVIRVAFSVKDVETVTVFFLGENGNVIDDNVVRKKVSNKCSSAPVQSVQSSSDSLCIAMLFNKCKLLWNKEYLYVLTLTRPVNFVPRYFHSFYIVIYKHQKFIKIT